MINLIKDTDIAQESKSDYKNLEKSILEKMSKKDMISYLSLKEIEKENFLKEKKILIDKRETKKVKMKSLLDGIRIEINEIGLNIEVNKSLLENEEKENYSQVLDFSQYSQFGKSTVRIKGTDGKEYGLLLTVLSYR